MAGRPFIRPPYIREIEDITEEHLYYTLVKMYNMSQVERKDTTNRNQDEVDWKFIPAGKMTNYIKVFNAKVKNEVLDRLIDIGMVKRTTRTNQTPRRVETRTYYSLTEKAIETYSAI